MSTNLNSIMSSKFTDEDQTQLRSYLTKTAESGEIMSSVAMADSIIMSNHKIRKQLNQRFADTGLKLDYSEFQSKLLSTDKTRSFTETANACNYVGCADIIIKLAESQCSVTDTFTQFALDECRLKIPVEAAMTLSMPSIAFDADLPVLSTTNLNYCVDVEAERFGAVFKVPNKDIKCNMCVDILEQFVRYVGYSMMRSKKLKGIQALQAGSTLVTITPSALNDVLVELKKKLRSIAIMNASRSGKIYAYLSTQAMDQLESIKDTQNRYIFQDFISKCTETCREYCAFGLTIREDSSIPTLPSGTGFASTIYIGYAEDAAFGTSGFEEINCLDCIDIRKGITRVGGQTFMEAVIPPSRVTSFGRASVVF